MSDYEPPAEMVDALAKELQLGFEPRADWANTTMNRRGEWHTVARVCLRRQHEREVRLLAELKWIANSACNVCASNAVAALAAHAKFDAPKVPTLLEAADALVRSANSKQSTLAAVDISAYQALKDAVEREEKREKR